MTVQLAIDWQTLRKVIQDWFRRSTELEIIWADQDQPQPEYPYASLNIISGPTRVGGRDDVIDSTDLTAPAGQEVELCHQGPREFTVNVQIHVGPVKDQSGTRQEPLPNCDARALLATAEAQILFQVTKQEFKEKALAFVRSQTPLSLDPIIAGDFVHRVSQDFEFSTMSRVAERTTFIEDATITGTITDPVGTEIAVDFSVDTTP